MIPSFPEIMSAQSMTPDLFARVFSELARSSMITAGAGLRCVESASGHHIDLDLEFPFWAKVTSGTNPYAWTEQRLTTAGTFTALTNGRSGTTTVNPAYEETGNAAVAANSFVLLYPGFNNAGSAGQEYLFDRPATVNSYLYPSYESFRQASTVDYNSGVYHFAGLMIGGASPNNLTMTANQLYGFPFIDNNSNQQPPAMAVQVITGSANKFRLGIYEADGAKLSATGITAQGGRTLPNTLIWDSGDQIVGAAQVKVVNIGGAGFNPVRGHLYWFVIVTNDSAYHFGAWPKSNCTCSVLGSAVNGNVFDPGYTGWTVPFTYGALPSPYNLAAPTLYSGDVICMGVQT